MPQPNPAIQLSRVEDRGEVAFIFHDKERGCYREASEGVYIIWSLCDGFKNLREICSAVASMGGPAKPEVVVAVVQTLAQSRMVILPGLKTYGQRSATKQSHKTSLMHWLRATLTVTFEFGGVDKLITVIYDSFAFWCFTKPAIILGALVCLAGLLLFPALYSNSSVISIYDFLWIVVPIALLTTILHESAHVFSVKHFGRKVLGVGLGWFWFHPIVFVNTTDMWLAKRWPRIAVSVAGPAVDLFVAGLLCCLAALVDPNLAGVVVVLSGFLYLNVIVNLSPFLEYDGYYALSDLLRRPHLRGDAFNWLFNTAGKKSDWLSSRYTIEIAYSLGCVVYLVITLVFEAIYSYFILTRVFGLETGSSHATWLVILIVCIAFGVVAAGLWSDARLLAEKPQKKIEFD